MSSVFEKYRPKAYPFNFLAELRVKQIAGGTPTDPKVAESWLKTKTGATDALLQEAISETMVERGVTKGEAIEIVNENRHLTGFKRDQNGLYLEGRCAKAALKEAANIRWPKERWGATRMGTLKLISEHVFVQEDRLYLGVAEPSGVSQRFVHTFRGSGIKYEEYVDDVILTLSIGTDWEFSEEEWALLWLTGEQQGIGASRSQGFGRYDVVRWERLPAPAKSSAKLKAVA